MAIDLILMLPPGYGFDGDGGIESTPEVELVDESGVPAVDENGNYVKDEN